MRSHHPLDRILVVFSAVAAVLSALLGKLLKLVINHERPTSVDADPGMPSSHATALWFLGVYLSATWTSSSEQIIHVAPFLPEPTWLAIQSVQFWRMAAAGGVLLVASILTLVRVYSGHHTLAQVSVGAALGSSCALL